MKKIPFILSLPFLYFLPAFNHAYSNSNSYPQDINISRTVSTRLFESDELIEITLSFDITTFKKKKSDTEYLDAVISYLSDNKDTIYQDIKIRARGEFRRTYCDFPPVHLNFRVKDSISGEFRGIDKIKLVPYCKQGYEDYLLREYLVYKLYNALTDYSLRVRLLRIRYVNTAKPSAKPLIQYGFVIEPVSVFEKRTGSVEIKTRVTQRIIRPEMMNRVAIFNYMTGNTDWSVPAMHNVIIFSQPHKGPGELGTIIPYDFDFCGLVNADYAHPFESLPIKSIRERLYLGLCRSEEEFKKVLE
ncbi:MAG: hypothetical protein ACUVTX_07320, partial [Bacteroidales bacterium]